MTANHVIIATGSRKLVGHLAVWAALDSTLAEHPSLRVRVGDCPEGLDAIVRGWSENTWGAAWRTYCRVYEADWDLWRLTGGLRGGGPARNADMVRDGAHACHAWFAPPPALNLGTSGCVKLARAAGIEVVPYGRKPQPVQMELPL